MIYVYTENLLNGSCEIAKAVGGEILRKFDGMNFWRKGKRVTFNPDDSLICWGAHAPEMDGVKIVNGIEPINAAKFHRDLSNIGYLAPECFPYNGNPNKKSSGLMGSGFLPRSNESREGNDLLTIPQNAPKADMWSTKWNFTSEWAVFVMGGKIMKVGLKVPKFKVALNHDMWLNNAAIGKDLSHPIVKTNMGGWQIDLNHETVESDLDQIKRVAKYVMNLYSPDFAQINVGYTSGTGFVAVSISLAPHVHNKEVLDLYVDGFVKMFNPKKAKVVEVETKPAGTQKEKDDLKAKKKLMRKASRFGAVTGVEIPKVPVPTEDDMREWFRNYAVSQLQLPNTLITPVVGGG